MCFSPYLLQQCECEMPTCVGFEKQFAEACFTNGMGQHVLLGAVQ